MTKAESKEFIEEFERLIALQKKELENLKDEISRKEENFSKRIANSPISLEKDILVNVKEAVSKSISESLKGYGSPLTKIVNQVIDEHYDEIKEKITKAFENSIRIDSFEKSLLEAFSHKVSRSVISNSSGLFDKVTKDLKNDAVFRSKATLAISEVVNECLKKRKLKDSL